MGRIVGRECAIILIRDEIDDEADAMRRSVT
jgi:hypothetical protein